MPAVVEASGLAENGWIPINPRTLETKFSGVYAIGDVANTGTPKAGVFAEGAARAVASSLIAQLGGAGQPELYAGTGGCYVEFGGGRVGRVDVDFFSGPKPTGVFTRHPPNFAPRRRISGSAGGHAGSVSVGCARRVESRRETALLPELGSLGNSAVPRLHCTARAI